MKNNIILITVSILLLGCSGLKKGIGIEKDKPDEFLIEKRDPIILPPNYNILPPDSKEQKKKIEENSLKSVLNQSIKITESEKQNESYRNFDLEQDILKKIK